MYIYTNYTYIHIYTYTRMIKKQNQVIRYSKFHVNVCYNFQPIHNELTLCVQWKISFFIQAVQQATCILCDDLVFLYYVQEFLVSIYFDGNTGRPLLSVCFIIFFQDHLLFPIFRANTNYIFLNWGCMIYSCLLCSRISVGEVYYLPVSSIQQIIQYRSCSFPH